MAVFSLTDSRLPCGYFFLAAFFFAPFFLALFFVAAFFTPFFAAFFLATLRPPKKFGEIHLAKRCCDVTQTPRRRERFPP